MISSLPCVCCVLSLSAPPVGDLIDVTTMPLALATGLSKPSHSLLTLRYIIIRVMTVYPNLPGWSQLSHVSINIMLPHSHAPKCAGITEINVGRSKHGMHQEVIVCRHHLHLSLCLFFGRQRLSFCVWLEPWVLPEEVKSTVNTSPCCWTVHRVYVDLPTAPYILLKLSLWKLWFGLNRILISSFLSFSGIWFWKPVRMDLFLVHCLLVWGTYTC